MRNSPRRFSVLTGSSLRIAAATAIRAGRQDFVKVYRHRHFGTVVTLPTWQVSLPVRWCVRRLGGTDEEEGLSDEGELRRGGGRWRLGRAERGPGAGPVAPVGAG